MELEGGLGASGFTGVLPGDRGRSDFPYFVCLHPAREAVTHHHNGGCWRRAGVSYKMFELMDEEDSRVPTCGSRTLAGGGPCGEGAVVRTVEDLTYAEEDKATKELWTGTPMALLSAVEEKVFKFSSASLWVLSINPRSLWVLSTNPRALWVFTANPLVSGRGEGLRVLTWFRGLLPLSLDGRGFSTGSESAVVQRITATWSGLPQFFTFLAQRLPWFRG